MSEAAQRAAEKAAAEQRGAALIEARAMPRALNRPTPLKSWYCSLDHQKGAETSQRFTAMH